MHSTANAILPAIVESEPAQVWFGHWGYVLRTSAESYSVMMGGTLLGSFDSEDVATRDILIAIVVTTLGRAASWSDVARAFRVGRSTVGRAMQRYKAGGLPAVADTGHQGGLTKRTPQLDRRLFEMFDQGVGVRSAHRVVKKRLSYGTVQTVHTEWLAKKNPEPVVSPQLVLDANSEDGDSSANDNAADVTFETETAEVTNGEKAAANKPGLRIDSLIAPQPPSQSQQRKEHPPEAILPVGRSEVVQHVGSWILLGLLAPLGVYDEAMRWSSKISRVTLRVAIDAIAVALALGQGCIEGVRRIGTSSAPLLLRHASVPSPSWVRRVLGKFALEAALMFRAHVTAALLRRSSHQRDRVWLYVDNHMRPYTGQETIRKGWRMQAKRAVPGTTDYYVHDEDGCPLWRVTSNEHESLSVWLPRVLELARGILGRGVEIVLSFDRGGAFPETLAGLRNLEGSFVTYERKPYALLAKTAFTEQLKIVLPSRQARPIVIRYTEAPSKNLRRKRGRVRRIALLTEEGAQINILTCSERPVHEVIRKHLARWGKQENQFKHGVERWGINQLDSRKVEHYPADAVIPNPDRRRVEHKITLARAAEGRARCELAQLEATDPRRQRTVEDIDRCVARREELESLRPTMPKRAAVRDTSLAGQLVRHTTMYKDVVDTLRIAFANIEADLAATLADHLDRPREAKKVIANLFAAPGSVRLGKQALRVRLQPAATASERKAIAKLLRSLNQRSLSLPGDPTRLRLHFSLERPRPLT